MAKYQDWLEPEGLLQIEGWARDGLTDEQICHNMGITVATLWAWRKKYPELSNALRKGKQVIDIQVENALLKRALGYDYTEYMIDEKGNKKAIKKQMTPDVTAQIFWLKNRKPAEWRDKRDIGFEGKLPVVISGDDDIAD